MRSFFIQSQKVPISTTFSVEQLVAVQPSQYSCCRRDSYTVSDCNVNTKMLKKKTKTVYKMNSQNMMFKFLNSTDVVLNMRGWSMSVKLFQNIGSARNLFAS